MGGGNPAALLSVVLLDFLLTTNARPCRQTVPRPCFPLDPQDRGGPAAIEGPGFFSYDPLIQWNRDGIGDSLLTFLKRLALATAIFRAHSVSLMRLAFWSSPAKLTLF